MQLAPIDHLILERACRTKVPAGIEAAYHAYRLRDVPRLGRLLIIPTLASYNIFLIVDYLLLPGIFWRERRA